MLRGLAVGLVAGVFYLAAASAVGAATFSNANPIGGAEGTVPCGVGGGYTLPSPYPSTITVSGVSGTISKVTVTLNNVTGWNNDFDVLLVGPAGQKFVLVSDSGSALVGSGVSLTLDDDAASALPATGSWGAGAITARPTDVAAEPDVWPAPAPLGPYATPAPTGAATLATTFNGINPNGSWSLYLTDDCLGDPSSIAGGWSLDLTTVNAESTSTALSSSANPSFTGDSVTFTAHVTKTADGSDVTGGTVTFKEGATTLASGVALSSSGRATFATSALTEGAHVITAFYEGTASFAPSNGSLTQTVDNRTAIVGNSYCNTGPVTVRDGPTVGTPGLATPYPSRVFVTGLGLVAKVTLTLKNVTHNFEDDIDVLLVGPGGERFVVVSDAGGGSPPGTPVSNVTVTFDDDAVATLSDDIGGWGAPGATVTVRPADFADAADVFPAPAPAAPYVSPAPTGTATFASVFGGTPGDGAWSLYVVDDGLPDSGSIAGGWCLNVVAPPTATDDAYGTTRNTPLAVAAPGVLANDSGVPSPSVVAASGATTQGGTFAVNADGSFSYTPATDFTGTDTFSYTIGNGGPTTDTATVTITVTAPEPPAATCNGLAATITGGPGDSVIVGTDGDDVIVDLDGNNTITAKKGNDTICVGTGDDKVLADDGDDWVDAGNGKNNVSGGNGNDRLSAGSGDDKVDGGAGSDSIDAASGKNNVSGGDGADVLVTGSGEDSVDGGSGDDTIDAGDGKNKVIGGAGNDAIRTGAGDDNVDGGAGSDTCDAGGGANRVRNCEA